MNKRILTTLPLVALLAGCSLFGPKDIDPNKALDVINNIKNNQNDPNWSIGNAFRVEMYRLEEETENGITDKDEEIDVIEANFDTGFLYIKEDNDEQWYYADGRYFYIVENDDGEKTYFKTDCTFEAEASATAFNFLNSFVSYSYFLSINTSYLTTTEIAVRVVLEYQTASSLPLYNSTIEELSLKGTASGSSFDLYFYSKQVQEDGYYGYTYINTSDDQITYENNLLVYEKISSNTTILDSQGKEVGKSLDTQEIKVNYNPKCNKPSLNGYREI